MTSGCFFIEGQHLVTFSSSLTRNRTRTLVSITFIWKDNGKGFPRVGGDLGFFSVQGLENVSIHAPVWGATWYSGILLGKIALTVRGSLWIRLKT